MGRLLYKNVFFRGTYCDFFGFARIFSEKSAQACSKRSETFINRKIGTFYIETISPFFSQLPQKYFFELDQKYISSFWWHFEGFPYKTL